MRIKNYHLEQSSLNLEKIVTYLAFIASLLVHGILFMEMDLSLKPSRLPEKQTFELVPAPHFPQEEKKIKPPLTNIPKKKLTFKEPINKIIPPQGLLSGKKKLTPDPPKKNETPRAERPTISKTQTVKSPINPVTQEKSISLQPKTPKINDNSFTFQYKKPNPTPKQKTHPRDFIPEEIKPSLRGSKPEKTNQQDINFTLDNYEWKFDDYIEKWAFDLKKWWRLPADYGSGQVPEGGSVWVKVTISKEGFLDTYRVYHSEVSSEMQLKVIQTLISSFARSPLPEDFPEEKLTINWHFMYMPYERAFDAKKTK